ncbi:chromosome transmission fidelity protein 18 homolog [Ostrinia nubilalis]|uniref:chromosome transmission fidelity protein 18 homolog n=1 Tax=Ostrinia nubilalis TaxID=29057 RepID=UPI0030822FE0
MSDYPDPDEEYELMYADDLELLKEHDDHIEPNVVKKKPIPAKRSLDFSSPGPKNASAEPVNKDTTNSDAISNRNATPSVSNTQISFSQSLQPMEELLTPVTSNKRTAEDLFGDIGDIDFDNVEMPTKKQKTEEENDLELIDKILESRRLRQLLLEPSRAQAETKPVFNTKENLSLDIPRWPFMALTNSDGDRIYVRLESETSWDQSLDSTEDQLSLQSMYAKTWDEARKILEKKQEAEILRQSQEPLPDISTDINGNNLWVDKYRPHSYIDLLSEEPVNRALLHWLHLWDKIVFKKEVKTTEPQQRNSFSKRTGQFQLSNKWKGKKEAGPEMDEDGRPHHKVALLCGPPGVGKTTLAHLLARLAGYRPVELNASDERSTDAFRNALQSATLMRSVIDAEKRPNCLILDEIDGAPLPTVELLVKWCTAAASEGKKKAKVQPLKRPVIAICNDLYATSLRPLRQVALIIQVGGVSLQRISSRLARVCSREGLSAPPHVLAALAARVHGDVRAAIHALSFIKARAEQGLSAPPHVLAALAARVHGDVRAAIHALSFIKARAEQRELKRRGCFIIRLARVCSREGLSAPPHVLAALAARVHGDVRAAIHALSFIKARADQRELKRRGCFIIRLARVCSREGLSAPPHVLAALAARVHGDVRAAIHALSFIKARADQRELKRRGCFIIRLARVCSREGLSAPPHVLAALAARVHGDVRAALHALSFIKARADQVSGNRTLLPAHTPPHVLAALAARVHGDVRAAIHALSFIKARAEQVSMEDVENTSVGSKDCSKSMMQALTAVFTTNDKDPNAIAKTVQAAGEYDRLVDGIFENYLQARVDARLLLACETLSWLRLYDAVHSWTLRHQNYSLYGLLPQCIVRCHRILASRNPQRVKFPMQAQEAHRKKTELDSIVWSVWRYSAPNVALTRRALQLDVIPLLPYLLAPTANIQLYRETERKALRTCASAMCDYALQYVQQRTPEGLYAFTLEPDVNKVALFGNHERLRPPPAVRQAIAREQQLEMIKRSEEMAQRVSNTNKEETKRKSTESKEGTSKDGATSKEVKESRLPNHLQRLKPKEIEKTTPQVHKDFFGRIVPLSQIQRSDAVPDVISSSRVFYQYREGFNNAVRRNVRTRDLL